MNDARKLELASKVYAHLVNAQEADRAYAEEFGSGYGTLGLNKITGIVMKDLRVWRDNIEEQERVNKQGSLTALELAIEIDLPIRDLEPFSKLHAFNKTEANKFGYARVFKFRDRKGVTHNLTVNPS